MDENMAKRFLISEPDIPERTTVSIIERWKKMLESYKYISHFPMVLTPEVRFINDWGRGDISGATGETLWSLRSIYRSSHCVVLRLEGRCGFCPWNVSNRYVARMYWTPERLHLTRDTIFHWEVDALSSVSILAMSTSERCSPMWCAAGDSVIVVEITVECCSVRTHNFKRIRGGRVHVARTVKPTLQ
jgi:hypothetical protein